MYSRGILCVFLRNCMELYLHAPDTNVAVGPFIGLNSQDASRQAGSNAEQASISGEVSAGVGDQVLLGNLGRNLEAVT